MPPSERVLYLSFESAEEFQREYSANLANGGVFIATDEAFQLREHVRVEIELPFCGQRTALEGEVVHLVTPEMAQLGAPAGIALQFEGTAQAVRGRLEPLRKATGSPQHPPVDPGRRRAPRTEARVPARILAAEGAVSGHTRDLSQTGVLIAVSGRGVPVGERVQLSISHPASGETMKVDGVVVREVESDGGVSAVAVEFDPSDSMRADMQRFVETIQSAEHARRLGGISGDVAELGVQNLLQMFGATASAGTLTLRDGDREGVIGFEGGLLRFVRLGPVSGMKALVRLLAWCSGSFEFHSRLDSLEPMDAPLPLEAALLEGLRMLDEERHHASGALPAEARPRAVKDASADESELSKVEAAVLDLVRAGFSVARMIAVIPEPDPEIQRALHGLRDRGLVTF